VFVRESLSLILKCAAKILGDYNPTKAFEAIGFEGWREALRKELDKSELPNTEERLVKEMVISSPKRILKREGDRILTSLKGVIYSQRYITNDYTILTQVDLGILPTDMCFSQPKLVAEIKKSLNSTSPC
jgi:hypothetical protein